eukprot:2728591-Rhodomonas_salina.1
MGRFVRDAWVDLYGPLGPAQPHAASAQRVIAAPAHRHTDTQTHRLCCHCYAMSGTDIGYAAISIRDCARKAQCGDHEQQHCLHKQQHCLHKQQHCLHKQQHYHQIQQHHVHEQQHCLYKQQQIGEREGRRRGEKKAAERGRAERERERERETSTQRERDRGDRDRGRQRA